MPDPHVLYVVTAVVVLGLVAWVIVVLARAPVLPEAPSHSAGGGAEEKAPEPTPPPKSEPAEPKASASEQPSKSHLDAHLEIQDEKDGADKPRDA